MRTFRFQRLYLFDDVGLDLGGRHPAWRGMLIPRVSFTHATLRKSKIMPHPQPEDGMQSASVWRMGSWKCGVTLIVSVKKRRNSPF